MLLFRVSVDLHIRCYWVCVCEMACIVIVHEFIIQHRFIYMYGYVVYTCVRVSCIYVRMTLLYVHVFE